MTLGSFSVILTMKRNGQPMEQINDFAGLSRTNPLLAFVFAMLLFSLAGIPPLAGFFAKWYVFVAAIKPGCSRWPWSACSPAWWARSTISASSR